MIGFSASTKLKVAIALTVVAIVITLPSNLTNEEKKLLGGTEEDEALFHWVCERGNFCEKQMITETTRTTAMSLTTCQLTCSPYAGLFPRPTQITFANTLMHLDVDNIELGASRDSTAIADLIQSSVNRFKADIQKRAPINRRVAGGQALKVTLELTSYDRRQLTVDTDESYTLTIALGTGAVIKANNFFGARHGLETLGQLMVFDDVQRKMQMPTSVTISDAPKYPHRGISLDTARSYIKLETIKRTFDGMAASKLNTFHWHISDTNSFPFVSRSHPKMSEIGAYSPEKVYTPEAIQDLVRYGHERGIRIIPELDTPAHVGEGWQDFDNYVACFNAKPFQDFCYQPPCGQLDPTKGGMYNILGDIYKDLLHAFDMDMFHMGGDEVNIPCWKSIPSIVQWMASKGWGQEDSDYMKLWDYFQTNTLAKFDQQTSSEMPIILWSSGLTTPENMHYLNKTRYIIQIWSKSSDTDIQRLLDAGFKLILSNYDHLYLDCGFSSWLNEGQNWCSPYKTWQMIYEHRPRDIAGDKVNQILGGETPLWAEQTDDAAIDSRIWPRAAAWGERLWSDPDESWEDATPRMLTHRERLGGLGIKADRLQPEWCYQHEDHCPITGIHNTPQPLTLR